MVPYWKIFGRLGNSMFQGAYIVSQTKKGLIPDIYIQSEEYFSDAKDEVRLLYGSNIRPMPFVSIHVRRGDYVNNPFYVDLFADGYYERAMALFPNAKFMVFSDDIEWCKGQELFKDCVFSEGFSEVEDLNRMAGCEGHIIANSSFSWWAAWLSGNKTIAPEKWYTIPTSATKLLDSWIKV